MACPRGDGAWGSPVQGLCPPTANTSLWASWSTVARRFGPAGLPLLGGQKSFSCAAPFWGSSSSNNNNRLPFPGDNETGASEVKGAGRHRQVHGGSEGLSARLRTPSRQQGPPRPRPGTGRTCSRFRVGHRGVCSTHVQLWVGIHISNEPGLG